MEYHVNTIRELLNALPEGSKAKLRELVAEAEKKRNGKPYEASMGIVHVVEERNSKHGHHYLIYCNGNMGTTMGTVEQLFDKLYFKGAFAAASKYSRSETGHPSYSWSMVVPAQKFDQNVRKKK